MLVNLRVLSADLGATVHLAIANTFNEDVGYDVIESAELTAAGSVKRIVSDFHNLFKLTVTVTGGSATYKVVTSVYDNAGTTRIENAQIDVDIDANADTLGHFDSIRIGDGEGDYVAVNDDGSINTNEELALDEETVSVYDEIAALPSGAESAIVTYTVPVDKIAFLYWIEASGENIARFKVAVNGDVIATRRTHHGSGLTTEFNFSTPNKRTYVLQPGDILTVKALHNRPQSGDFEARVEMLLKDAP